MSRVEVEGLRIAYERAGSGPAVVLTHGFVGDGVSTWAAQLEALSDEFTVVAWDVPGAGRSSEVPERFRLPDYADCFAAFLRILGLDRAHLVGLSLGGAMMLATFERHRTVPRSLVLVGAYAGWPGSLAPDEVEGRLRTCLARGEPPHHLHGRGSGEHGRDHRARELLRRQVCGPSIPQGSGR